MLFRSVGVLRVPLVKRQFTTRPTNTPTSVKGLRVFLEGLKSGLQIYQPSDWYNVKTTELEKMGATPYLQQFQGDLWYGMALSHFLTKPSQLLRFAFPSDYDWKPFLFKRAPPGFWEDKRNRRVCLDWVMKEELGLSELSGWYVVEFKNLGSFGYERLKVCSYL